MNKEENAKTCCLCGGKYWGWGNNAWPLDNEGRCCDACNFTKVVPARLRSMKRNKEFIV